MGGWGTSTRLQVGGTGLGSQHQAARPPPPPAAAVAQAAAADQGAQRGAGAACRPGAAAGQAGAAHQPSQHQAGGLGCTDGWAAGRVICAGRCSGSAAATARGDDCVWGGHLCLVAALGCGSPAVGEAWLLAPASLALWRGTRTLRRSTHTLQALAQQAMRRRSQYEGTPGQSAHVTPRASQSSIDGEGGDAVSAALCTLVGRPAAGMVDTWSHTPWRLLVGLSARTACAPFWARPF